MDLILFHRPSQFVENSLQANNSGLQDRILVFQVCQLLLELIMQVTQDLLFFESFLSFLIPIVDIKGYQYPNHHQNNLSNSRSTIPARLLALSLKMSTRHFLHAQSWKKGGIYLVVDASRYENFVFEGLIKEEISRHKM